jgi:hypothetical protein
MSRTREVKKDELPQWLDLVSRLGTDRQVRLEVEGTDIGDQELAGFLPFMGIDLDAKGSARGAIEILMESGGSGALRHAVERPRHVYALENDQGSLECIEIEDASGAKVLAYFDRPIDFAVERAPSAR